MWFVVLAKTLFCNSAKPKWKPSFIVECESEIDFQRLVFLHDEVRKRIEDHHANLLKEALRLLKPLFRCGYVDKDEILRGIVALPDRNKQSIVIRAKRLQRLT